MINMRKAYGEALVELGQTNPDVVALSADVSNSDFSFMFQEAFPDRFFNVGIAEQSLVDVAAGLAYCGKIPFANTFAFLFATRALEMVRTHLCYGGANVKLMAAYAGLSNSFDGPTHHAITDIAIMRSLPNMTVVVPGDTVAVAKLLPQVAAWKDRSTSGSTAMKCRCCLTTLCTGDRQSDHPARRQRCHPDRQRPDAQPLPGSR